MVNAIGQGDLMQSVTIEGPANSAVKNKQAQIDIFNELLDEEFTLGPAQNL